MAKERINVTVDPEVKREIEQRADFNVSGAVNDYLKRRLAGERKDDAQLRIEIERHEDAAESLRKEAEAEERKAERKRQLLRNRQQDRAERVNDVIDRIEVEELRSTGPYVATDDDRLEELADEADLPVDRLRQRALERYQNGSDGTQQRHYQ